MRDASLSLLPDFARGGFVMGAPVGVIRILVRIKTKIGMAFSILTRDLYRSIGALRRIGIDDICAVGSSRVDLQACKLEYSIVSPK